MTIYNGHFNRYKGALQSTTKYALLNK